MATLIFHQGLQSEMIEFDAPKPLSVLLEQANLSLGHPCGGRGTCGKCAVALSGNVSSPNAAEVRFGVRLACQAIVTGDAEVTLPIPLSMTQIEGGSKANLTVLAPMNGQYGAAIDIGTTTIALLLYELSSGRCLGAANMQNPQTSVSADVIGRIDAAINGRSFELKQQIEAGIGTLLASACAQTGITPNSITALVITGNTTMLYLLTGRTPHALARAPFQADCLFGFECTLLNRKTFLPACLHAFVGADTTCALLACGMTQHEETSLLCDVGTNGELALWHQGRLYIASTAAGPAFEGAGISCGCSSVPGAIDRVEFTSEGLICHTIGDEKAIGVCGSGLLDAIASMLDSGELDESGFLEDDKYHLRDGISLIQSDIRAVQLAKAATYAGIMSLLSAANCSLDEVKKLYLAGGFGSHLNIRSAVRVGLIPEELADRVHIIGNAALDGAAMLLMNTNARDDIAAMSKVARHIRLDGNAEFAQLYIEAMMFAES